MLITHRRCRIPAIAAVALFGFPAVALADAAGSKVLRIDPSTGARKVLANNGDWHALPGIAVASSGTVYFVSGEGRGRGIFSLTGPGFAIAQLKTGDPELLAASGQTLYTLNSSGLVGTDTNPPFAGKFVTDGQPDFLGIAASASTVYGTWAEGCAGRAATGAAGVAAIDATTGARTEVAKLALCPEEPRGIAVAPDGTLVVATATTIVRVNPANGSSTTLSKGGLLRNAGKLAVTASGDVIVADATSGVLRIAGNGRQSTIASGGDLIGVNAVAVDAAGTIYVTVPPGSPLEASAPKRQRYNAARGIRIDVACQPLCGISYSVKVTGVSPVYNETAELQNKHENSLFITSKRTAYIKLDAKGSRRIATALSRNRTVTATLSLTPVNDHFDAVHGPTTLKVRLVR